VFPGKPVQIFAFNLQEFNVQDPTPMSFSRASSRPMAPLRGAIACFTSRAEEANNEKKLKSKLTTTI